MSFARRFCEYCGGPISGAKRADARFCKEQHRAAHWKEARAAEGAGSYVYFIQGELGGPIKIGHALDPEHRLDQLQCGSPVPLVIRKIMPGGAPLESELHRRFAKHRLAGEWFASVDELAELADAPSIAAHDPEVYRVVKRAYLQGYEEGHQAGRKAREDANFARYARAHEAAVEAAQRMMVGRPDLQRLAAEHGIQVLFPLVARAGGTVPS